MNLIVFDCDNTLWNLPYNEDDTFMETPESITEYDFKYKQNVIDIYNEKRKDTNNKFAILTNRKTNIENVILERLYKDKGLKFDYILFRENDRDKSKRLNTIITDNVEYIEFYDDKDKHINCIKTLIPKYLDIKFKTFKV